MKVAIVGAGIVGTATAHALARRGVDVELLDAGEVSGGTTGLGEGNVLLSDKRPGPELELALLGMAAYEVIERRLGSVARIRRKGSLIVHRDGAALAAEAVRLEPLRAAGVECELLEPERALALEPALRPGIAGASLFPGDLQCDPRAITRALAAELGDRVRTGRRVGRLDELDADAVVLAAGAWSAELARGAGIALPLEPRKGQLVRLSRAPELVGRKVVDGGYLAAVESRDAGLVVSTVVETTWDGHVLVGSSRERRGFDSSVDAAVTAALLQHAAALIPGVARLAVDGAWAGLRPWLPDGLPALGPSRAAPGVWVATGHEGAGVGLGPISGELVAAAICGERPALDLSPFDPDRFEPRSA